MATMKEIADAVGVSQATVSLVLGEHPLSQRVGARTRKRVLEAARSLGYRKNAVAQAMVTGRRLIVGFGAYRPELWHNAITLAALTRVIEDAGYIVKAFNLRSEETELSALIDRLISYQLGGILCVSPPVAVAERFNRECRAAGIPVVYIHGNEHREFSPRVFSDDASGYRQIVAHLFSLGHRHFAFVGSSEHAREPYAVRKNAVERALREFDLALPQQCVFTYESDELRLAEESIDQLVRLKPRPTAIICRHDVHAAVCLRRLRAHGLHVPLDISVAGYSGYQVGELTDPPLTTVRQNFDSMGELAARTLLGILRGGSGRSIVHPQLVPVDLLVRGSTGAIRTVT